MFLGRDLFQLLGIDLYPTQPKIIFCPIQLTQPTGVAELPEVVTFRKKTVRLVRNFFCRSCLIFFSAALERERIQLIIFAKYSK